MKKFLLSIIALATVATASAQGFGWGVKAGVNFSSVYGDISNVEMKTDFVGGVFGEYKTNNWFGISAELLYAGQGYRIKDADYQTNTSHLNIPIMANFHVCKFMSLGTGVQPGFLLGAKIKDGTRTDDVKNAYKSFDLAIPINVRFQLDFGLMFDLRYNIGVTNIDKIDPDGDKMYNDGFAVTVGWKF